MRYKSDNKERITIRIDHDILQWFRSQTPGGHGYQSRLNMALREHLKSNGKDLENTIRNIVKDSINESINSYKRKVNI